MRAKQRYIKQWFVFLLCVLPVSFGITAQNQTLLNHKRSRNLNREGYPGLSSWQLGSSLVKIFPVRWSSIHTILTPFIIRHVC